MKRVIFISFLLFLPRVAFAFVVWDIKSQVNIDRSQVILSDLVECSGDLAVCEVMGQVEYKPSLDPGSRETIAPEQIESWISARGLEDRIRLKTRQSAVIFYASHGLKKEFLKDSLEDEMLLLNEESKDYRVSLKDYGFVKHPKLRHDRYRYKFSNFYRIVHEKLSERQSQSIVVPVVATEDEGDSVVEFSVKISLSVKKPFLVFVENMERLQIIDESNVTVKWFEAARSGQFASHLDQVIWKELKTDQREGSRVRMSSLRKPRLVKRGSLVQMKMKRGQLQIHSHVKALEHGSQDDLIRVLSPVSKKVLRAKVTRKDFVEFVR